MLRFGFADLFLLSIHPTIRCGAIGVLEVARLRDVATMSGVPIMGFASRSGRPLIACQSVGGSSVLRSVRQCQERRRLYTFVVFCTYCHSAKKATNLFSQARHRFSYNLNRFHWRFNRFYLLYAPSLEAAQSDNCQYRPLHWNGHHCLELFQLSTNTEVLFQSEARSNSCLQRGRQARKTIAAPYSMQRLQVGEAVRDSLGEVHEGSDGLCEFGWGGRGIRDQHIEDDCARFWIASDARRVEERAECRVKHVHH